MARVKKVSEKKIECVAKGKQFEIVLKDPNDMKRIIETVEEELDHWEYPDEGDTLHPNNPNFYNREAAAVIADVLLGGGYDVEIYD